MSRKKLVKFAANTLAPNVIEEGKPIYETIKGHWAEYFGNDKPIVLELGCGRGEYSVGLARAYKDKNFIGVDIKGNRIWRGSQTALEEGLHNVAFLRCHIQNIEQFFNEGEIAEIWITFPDPRPKGRDEKRRMTSIRFLESYHKLLLPGGVIHLKTDHPSLYQYTLELLTLLGVEPEVATQDLYQSPYADLHLGIKTHYEKIWTDKGFSIKYCRFGLRDYPVLPADYQPRALPTLPPENG